MFVGLCVCYAKLSSYTANTASAATQLVVQSGIAHVSRQVYCHKKRAVGPDFPKWKLSLRFPLI